MGDCICTPLGDCNCTIGNVGDCFMGPMLDADQEERVHGFISILGQLLEELLRSFVCSEIL